MSLTEIIKSKGRTISWMADKLSISRITLYNWDKNKDLISMKNYKILKKELGNDFVKWFK